MSPTSKPDEAQQAQKQPAKNEDADIKEDYAGFFYPNRESYFNEDVKTEKPKDDSSNTDRPFLTWKLWNISLDSFENRRHLKCLLRVKQCLLEGLLFFYCLYLLPFKIKIWTRSVASVKYNKSNLCVFRSNDQIINRCYDVQRMVSQQLTSICLCTVTQY